MSKRLFLFASYDRDAVIDDYVVYYVRALAELGDVIFWMDSDATPEELDKVSPYAIYAKAERHNSYDFGSYKRAYQWADAQGILNNYDFLYLCNDSCFGPFRPLKPALENMESKNADWFGFVADTDPRLGRYIQSWFIGMTPRIFLADWWKLFINSIARESNKDAYIYKYEFFMSRLALIFDVPFFPLFENIGILGEPEKLLAAGLPFIKRLGYFALSQNSSMRGFAPRARALKMLNHQQREMVIRYIHRINPVVAWLVVHPIIYSFVYAFKRMLRRIIKIRSSKRKEFEIRVLGVPVFYRNKKTA